ncbi:Hypothetical predicted protein [Octopus vulgaris]|uniref:Uncharacterized protein n=1 Tax=Octopus vulgaris TaxID=6645 RepID=A0AA36AMD3_OCTVU|nr:Hypothetical predicted protein [Octopus vulgaris]
MARKSKEEYEFCSFNIIEILVATQEIHNSYRDHLNDPQNRQTKMLLHVRIDLSLKQYHDLLPVFGKRTDVTTFSSSSYKSQSLCRVG